MSNKHFPLWLQHANGDIPTPTPAEVEKDFQREHSAAMDAINGKPDSKETRDMHAALMADYGSMTLDGKPTGGRMAALGNALARIDWHKVFIRTATVLSIAAVALLAFQYFNYFTVLGAGALSMIGQFAIGLFFMFSVMNASNGLQIMTAALGMYLLVNSF